MNGLPYYKAYPRDFIEGTIGMDFETKGAYRLVLDLIYMQGGKLPDDARYISGQLGCSVRKWNAIRDRLLEAGKLDLFEGFISNKRARKELESLRKLQEQNAENRRGANKNKDLEKRPSNHTEPEPEPDKEKELSEDSSKKTGDGAEHLQPDGPEEPPPQKTKKRATRLAPDWVPSGEQINFALKEGLDHAAANREADKFRDYWIGVGGQKGTKLDWDATWKNWVRRAADQRPRNAYARSPHQALSDGFAASVDIIEGRAGRFGEGPPSPEQPNRLKLVSGSRDDFA